MRRGLFGRQMPMPGVISGIGGGTFNMDGSPAGMPRAMPEMRNVPTTAGGRYGNPLPAAMPAQKGGGVKGALLAALGGAADGAAQFFGGRPLIAEQQQFDRFAAMRQAEIERNRALDLANYRARLEMQQEFAPPEEAPAFIRNAEAFYSLSPEEQARVVAVQDIVNPLMRPGPDGQFYPVQRPRPVTQSDWDSATPIGGQQQASPSGPAAPIRGAQTINRREYNEMLNRRFGGDQRAMNAWMAQNNIIAGGN